MPRDKTEPEPSWSRLEGETEGEKYIADSIFNYQLKRTITRVEDQIRIIKRKKLKDEHHRGLLFIFEDFIKRHKEEK